ncbi:MAG: hypothetical protein OSJ72_18170 [Lachnospiraceae bacterium]|nr:hypothetical protein [Lachnospiraceae bacterium]
MNLGAKRIKWIAVIGMTADAVERDNGKRGNSYAWEDIVEEKKQEQKSAYIRCSLHDDITVWGLR